MRVVIVALISASFIVCTSAKVKTTKKKPSDAPVVTLDYLLYEPDGETAMWISEFNSSLDKVYQTASRWLRKEIYYNLKLQTGNIAQVDEYTSSKVDDLRKKGKEVNPFDALHYVIKEAKELTDNPSDILCLVTKTPLTIYKGGFGLYHPLCKDVVPLILTYDSKNITATGESLGFLIRDTLNISNVYTWVVKTSEEERKQRFDNCQIQRQLKKETVM
ncbi:uncharacterized protein LOC120845284 [Ixodes scapularis]|uniref:uncharacterized protein LOC120845284 n=1 Tax=Ixodes scapularis TaxID=6945 RepID=UPI001A9F6D60|nr:uncharacterized protein LOC120845284 [Ixodes scapularis]